MKNQFIITALLSTDMDGAYWTVSHWKPYLGFDPVEITLERKLKKLCRDMDVRYSRSSRRA